MNYTASHVHGLVKARIKIQFRCEDFAHQTQLISFGWRVEKRYSVLLDCMFKSPYTESGNYMACHVPVHSTEG